MNHYSHVLEFRQCTLNLCTNEYSGHSLAQYFSHFQKQNFLALCRGIVVERMSWSLVRIHLIKCIENSISIFLRKFSQLFLQKHICTVTPLAKSSGDLRTYVTT